MSSTDLEGIWHGLPSSHEGNSTKPPSLIKLTQLPCEVKTTGIGRSLCGCSHNLLLCCCSYKAIQTYGKPCCWIANCLHECYSPIRQVHEGPASDASSEIHARVRCPI